MSVPSTISPAMAEEALEAFCQAFSEKLKDIVEARVVAEPEMTIEVGFVPGIRIELPATVPGYETCAISSFESDAQSELLSPAA